MAIGSPTPKESISQGYLPEEIRKIYWVLIVWFFLPIDGLVNSLWLEIETIHLLLLMETILLEVWQPL